MKLLNAINPITLENLTMSDEFRTWALQLVNEVNALTPIVGAGSPEGVVSAPQYSLYLNSAGISGTIEYRKMLPDVGGDITQGWIAV